MATIEMSTDLARMITSILSIGLGGTGSNTALTAFNNLAAGLGTATGDFNDTTYFVTTNNSGATNDYYRRSYSILKGNIKTYLTPNIITSIAYSGDGNAVTALSLSAAGVLTVTKGATYNNYSLPLATSSTRGGVKIGYTTDAANRNYAVQLSNEQMYVNVPWVDHDHYAWTDITGRPTIDKTTVIYQISRGSSFDPIQSGYWAGMTTQSGIDSNWWHVLSMDWSGNDANNWISQLAIPTDTRNGIYYRTRHNSTTNTWIKCLDANNYADYTVTKTGSGASGTWGISISGTAANATYVKDRTNNTATYLNYGASGLAASAITWLCCWNGYEVRAISKAEMANAVDSAHKWVRIGGDTMTGALYSTALWANQGSSERQAGVSYNGGNLYFWGNPSSGTAGIYDTNGGYVIQRETTYNKYNSYFSRTEITNHLLCSTKTAGNAYTESGSAIQIREVGLVGSAQSAWTYAPKIGFHWGSRCALQLGMDSSEWLQLYVNNSTNHAPMALSRIIVDGANGLRFVGGSSTTQSMLLRNDGSDFWFLCCNAAGDGDNWYTPTCGGHPCRINLLSGIVYITSLYVTNTITGSVSGNATTCSYPAGFGSRVTNCTWGDQTGSTATCWDIGSCAVEFRRDNPSSGKLSIKVDGRFYGNEGAYPAMLLRNANGYWGMGNPDAGDDWIRTTTYGIIPNQSGGNGAGHCGLGTSSWWFSYIYADNHYGTFRTNHGYINYGATNGGINMILTGDDAWIGDCNIGGHVGIKSNNSSDAGMAFYNSSGSQLGRIYCYSTTSMYLYNANGWILECADRVRVVSRAAGSNPWAGSAIEVREVAECAANQSSYTYSPRVGFHWGNRCAGTIGLESDNVMRVRNQDGGSYKTFQAGAVWGAVWNDYVEYREADSIEPGYCYKETESGIMTKTTKRLEPGVKLSSDTFGFAIGKTKKAQTPISVSGRVLAYPYKDRNEYHLGDAVCSAPNGTIDVMTREEIMMYPERIIGTVSEIPKYDIWFANGDNECGDIPIEVNGRIWIYVR